MHALMYFSRNKLLYIYYLASGHLQIFSQQKSSCVFRLVLKIANRLLEREFISRLSLKNLSSIAWRVEVDVYMLQVGNSFSNSKSNCSSFQYVRCCNPKPLFGAPKNLKILNKLKTFSKVAVPTEIVTLKISL